MKLENINNDWDMVIIGGGITGAGILREAARMGLSVLLVEKNDFAWGTSSRSSKMVHGGLRYLKEGDVFLTWASVRERERMIKEMPGLVEPARFIMPLYKGQFPGRITMGIGLSFYSILAMKRQHSYLNPNDLAEQVPIVNKEGLVGGFQFIDAQVDDSRLVLRLIQDSVSDQVVALNYTQVKNIHRNEIGRVTHITLEDTETYAQKKVYTSIVVNATGVSVESLHPSPDSHQHIRPLRGSHLVFPAEKFNLKETISFIHPDDHRPIFATPWEGVVLFGTTDVDHRTDLNMEPRMTREEAEYLMIGLKGLFPSLKIDLSDCIASFAGVRPVLSSGGKDPSKESREHLVWVDRGLVTVTGGKLTTFRLIAMDTLKASKQFLTNNKSIKERESSNTQDMVDFNRGNGCSDHMIRRLYGRYGKKAIEIIKKSSPAELKSIPGTETLLAEIPFIAQNEEIRHLSDLMLRHIRIGILLPEGGRLLIQRIKELCSPYLNWDQKKWEQEIIRYIDEWNTSYSVQF